MERIVEGRGTIDDVDRLHDIANNVMGNTICAFGEGMAMPALGLVKKFRKDFEAWVRGERTLATATLTPVQGGP
jgi:NADH-quinone oxidoreductase subunit F